MRRRCSSYLVRRLYTEHGWGHVAKFGLGLAEAGWRREQGQTPERRWACSLGCCRAAGVAGTGQALAKGRKAGCRHICDEIDNQSGNRDASQERRNTGVRKTKMEVT